MSRRRVGPSSGESLELSGAGITARGMPLASTRFERLVPCLALLTRPQRLKESAEAATIVAMSQKAGVTLAEVGFLLILFAGVWLVAAQIPAFKIPVQRTIVAGIALALAGVLLIIATHWGHFGGPS